MNFDDKYPEAIDNPLNFYNSQMARVQEVKQCFICEEYTQWIFENNNGKAICSEECLKFHKIIKDTIN